MDSVTHIFLGGAIAQLMAGRKLGMGRAFILGGVAASLPDLDVFIRTGDTLRDHALHRHFMHSLAFVPVLALMATIPFVLRRQRRREFWTAFMVALVACISHPLLDSLTSYGTCLFWPFTEKRYSFDWIAVVDPLFTLPLMIGTLWTLWRRMLKPAAIGLALALAYMGLAGVQHERAMSAQRDLLAARGLTPEVVTENRVLPQVGGIVTYRSIYMHEGLIVADAIRPGWPFFGTAMLKEGGSVPLVRPEDLKLSSERLRRDAAELAWFMDGYIARDPLGKKGLFDMRYTTTPEGLESAWDVQLEGVDDPIWETKMRWSDTRGVLAELFHPNGYMDLAELAGVCKNAQALEASGDSKQAIDMLKRWADDHPGEAVINEVYADMVLRSVSPALMAAIGPQLYDRTAVYYQRAVKADPSRGRSARMLATIYASQQRYAEAAEVLKKALPANAKDAELHLLLANALTILGDYKRAGQEYEIGIALDDRNTKAMTQFGLMLLDDKQPDLAERSFRRAMGIERTSAALHVDLGRALRDQGKISAAFSEFESARDLDDKNVPALVEMATTYLLLGPQGEREAGELLRGALTIDHDNLDVLLRLAKLMLTSQDAGIRDVEGAGLLLRAAVKGHPSDLNLRASYAYSLVQAGKLQEAADAYDDAANLARRMKADEGIVNQLVANAAMAAAQARPGVDVDWSRTGTPFDVTPARPWGDPLPDTVGHMMDTPLAPLWRESQPSDVEGGRVFHFPKGVIFNAPDSPAPAAAPGHSLKGEP